MTTKAAYELAHQLGRAGIDAPLHTLDLLCRHARSLHTLSEAQCNGFSTWDGKWDEAAEKRAEKREASLQDRIRTLCVDLSKYCEQGDIVPVFQGDPRGAVVKLRLPNALRAYHDSWGGEGVCVPMNGR